ncbi:MAG: glycosyltransferase [Chloroflexi bacterium]|nr:glycosyltransferase [Chloroflexota bacterium]
MKISIVGPTWPFRGGIAHYTTLLVKHLREAGHSVRFISYLKQYPQWLYPGNTAMDPSDDSSVLRIESDRVLTPLNPLTWWKAFRIMQQEKPDLVILQWWTPFFSPMLFMLTRLLRYYTKTKILFLCHHLIAPDGGVLDWFLAQRALRHQRHTAPALRRLQPRTTAKKRCARRALAQSRRPRRALFRLRAPL